jgi:hypothetical protein
MYVDTDERPIDWQLKKMTMCQTQYPTAMDLILQHHEKYIIRGDKQRTENYTSSADLEHGRRCCDTCWRNSALFLRRWDRRLLESCPWAWATCVCRLVEGEVISEVVGGRQGSWLVERKIGGTNEIRMRFKLGAHRHTDEIIKHAV